VFLMQGFGLDTKTGPAEEAKSQAEAMAQEVRPGAERQEYLERVFLSPDGRKVVAFWKDRGKPRRRARLYPFTPCVSSRTATGGRTVEVPPGDGAWVSNDGKFLLVRAQEDRGPARLVAFDLAAGKDGRGPAWEVAQPKDERFWPASCFSPDGRRVVLVS